ncbi:MULTISPECIES: hypothetical protein [unclassified Polaromonas]|uniref:hypothetical protein n=2 Tax=unclassified Polaromonas TaxID=2638319 RepID=UPI0025D31058|nr:MULTISPECIES: hypothetical protein [unclassified Polaromonas]
MMKLSPTVVKAPRFGGRVVALGLTALTACAAMAQTAGPALTVPGVALLSGELGALILSPAQRRNLESVRNAAGNADGGVQVLPKDPSGEAATGLPDTLVVSGVVVRSGNRSTVWVNDQPLYGRAAANPLRTLAGQAGVLQSGGQDMQLKARPGQVIDVPSGQAVDLLPPGAIRIIPPKAGTGGSTPKE